MNILVLHGLGEDFLERARGTSIIHLLSFQRHRGEHNYYLQDVQKAVSRALRDFPFDVVLIDGTFLCWRWVRPRFLLDQLRDSYAWLGSHPAVKIAFPQDDYDQSRILVAWLSELRVDYVYSVCREHHEVLYPLMSARPDSIGTALTGYVDDVIADRMQAMGRPPIASRPIDVGYRARDLPAYFGSFGRLKAEIGRIFSERASGSALNLDISCDSNDALIGERWTDFLLDSKCSLGCSSGSSVLDEFGDIRDAVETYVAAHPTATFEEIEAHAFPGLDNRYLFDAVSPRLFEAAVFGSCQILLEGAYLPGIHAGEHYVELKRDFSNLHDVLGVVRDPRAAQTIADACFEALIVPTRYRYSQRVAEVFERISKIRASRGLRDNAQATSNIKFHRMAAQHERALERLDPLYSEQARLERELATLQIQSPWRRCYRPAQAWLNLVGVRANIRRLGFPGQPPRRG